MFDSNLMDNSRMFRKEPVSWSGLIHIMTKRLNCTQTVSTSQMYYACPEPRHSSQGHFPHDIHRWIRKTTNNINHTNTGRRKKNWNQIHKKTNQNLPNSTTLLSVCVINLLHVHCTVSFTTVAGFMFKIMAVFKDKKYTLIITFPFIKVTYWLQQHMDL